MGARRVHLRADRDGSRDRRRAGRNARDADADGRRLGPRLLGPDPVHAADGAGHHHRPRARHVAADGAADPRDRRRGRARRAARWRSSPSSRWRRRGSTGASAWSSARCSRSRSRGASNGVDYRALAAASMLGLGSIWAQGLSGSAALQMATPGALQPQIRDIVAHGGLVPGGLIPFRHTIFLWQSFVVGRRRDRRSSCCVMWLATPPAGRGQDRARSRHRSRRVDETAERRTTNDADSRAVARTLADLDVVRRRARRRLPRSLLLAGGRAAERAQPEHPEPRASCCSDFCCTARRRG